MLRLLRYTCLYILALTLLSVYNPSLGYYGAQTLNHSASALVTRLHQGILTLAVYIRSEVL